MSTDAGILENESEWAEAHLFMQGLAQRSGHRIEAPVPTVTQNLKPDISLHNYVKQAWHVLEPVRPFTDNWHIGAVSEHLTACNLGQITHLIINIPPGTTKSLLTCVFWFTWTWTYDPSSRWLFSSHTSAESSPAVRDSLKSRTLIQSSWYQERYGHIFQFKGDQNLKTSFENTRTGFRVARGAGSGTGLRGKFIVTDDPHEITKAESDNDRNKIIQWWNETMSLRGEDTKSIFVIIMQRLHPQDLTGDQIARELGYEHLMIPMEFEHQHPFISKTSLGFVDPRVKEGEILDPVRFPADHLPMMKRRLRSPHAVAGQLQQRPTAREGEMFHRDWFKKAQFVPLAADRVRYWDKAGTAGGGDWTVGALVARKVRGRYTVLDPRTKEPTVFVLYDYYIEDVVYGQWSLGKREREIKRVADADAVKYGEGEVKIYMEQEPGSAGKDVTQLSIANLAGHRAFRDLPGSDGNKEVRAEPFATAAENGDFYILDHQPWTELVLDKIGEFPHGGEDFVDAIGGAFRKLVQFRAKKPKKKSVSTSIF